MKLWLMYDAAGWETGIFTRSDEYAEATHLCVVKLYLHYEYEDQQKGNNLITEDHEFYNTLMGWVLTGEAYIEEIVR